MKIDNAVKAIKTFAADNPRLSVLVRVRNEAIGLPGFLDSLRRQSIFQYIEVIFLDSGSSDETLEIIDNFPCAIYQIDSDIFQFGSSCNMLCKLATAEWLMLASGHVKFTSDDALELALKSLEERGVKWGYFRQVPRSDLGSSAYERAFLRRRYPASETVKCVAEVGGFSNACSIFHSSLWRREEFPCVDASEDFLWARKIIERERVILYFGNISIEHSHNEPPDTVSRRVRMNVAARGKDKTWRISRIPFYFFAVFATVLFEGGGLAEAFLYARAHAGAYWR